MRRLRAVQRYHVQGEAVADDPQPAVAAAVRPDTEGDLPPLGRLNRVTHHRLELAVAVGVRRQDELGAVGVIRDEHVTLADAFQDTLLGRAALGIDPGAGVAKAVRVQRRLRWDGVDIGAAHGDDALAAPQQVIPALQRLPVIEAPGRLPHLHTGVAVPALKQPGRAHALGVVHGDEAASLKHEPLHRLHRLRVRAAKVDPLPQAPHVGVAPVRGHLLAGDENDRQVGEPRQILVVGVGVVVGHRQKIKAALDGVGNDLVHRVEPV